MKSFLEEYGIVIVVAVVILALIGVAIIFRDSAPEKFQGFLEQFFGKAEIASGGGEGGGGE